MEANQPDPTQPLPEYNDQHHNYTRFSVLRVLALFIFVFFIAFLSFLIYWFINRQADSQNKQQVAAPASVTPSAPSSTVLVKPTIILTPLVMRCGDPCIASPTPTPVLITGGPPPEPTTTGSQPYGRGQSLPNAGFAINYPQGWTVQEQTSWGGYYRAGQVDYFFELLPLGVPSNPGGLDITVDPPQRTIEDWFNTYLSVPLGDGTKSQLSDYSYTTSVIGNKTAYFLQVLPGDKGYFTSRWVVLGTTHAYEIGFSNGGGGYVQDIEKQIFPRITFN